MKLPTNKEIDPLVIGTTPGEVLAAEFLEPPQITPYRLAAETGMPRSRISAILNGKRAITAETALAFALYFGTSPELWVNLQSHYHLEKARLESFERIKAMVKQLRIAQSAPRVNPA